MNWNTRLFLHINHLQGKSKKMDSLMFFCATFLIYILGAYAAVFLYATLADQQLILFIRELFFVSLSIILGLVASYGTALVWPTPRPIIALKALSKQLIHPLENWKTFPSDHTMMSFIFAESLYWLHAPIFIWSGAVVLGVTVGFSRIYAGVHYPKDILGGILYATIICAIVFGRLG